MIAVLLLILSAVVSPKESLVLPRRVAHYREWQQLLKDPHPVPLQLWIQCVAPRPADWKAAREKYGPHTQRYIRVYRNNVAAGNPARLPVGTIIAKEKLRDENGLPDGVAFMIKHPRSEFPESDGWQFLYFPTNGQTQTTQKDCASCHHAASARDYVFGTYAG